jgi:hypothetical protein
LVGFFLLGYSDVRAVWSTTHRDGTAVNFFLPCSTESV